MPVVCSFAVTCEDAVGVDPERHLEARHARGHRRDAREREARERAAVARRARARPARTWMSKPFWLSANVVKICAGRRGDRRVARDDLLDDAAHRLEPERERDHVEEQHLVLALPRRRAGRPGPRRRARRPGRDRCRRAARLPNSSATYARTAGTRVEPPTRITPSSSLGLHPGVAQRAPARDAGARDERRDPARRTRRGVIDRAGRAARARPSTSACVGEPLLRRARRVERDAHLRRASGSRRAHRREQPLGERAVDVVAAERAVAAGRLHLEDAVVELEDRDVERAAAEVVDGERARAASCRGRTRAPPRSAR